jgi:hypothetical protein
MKFSLPRSVPAASIEMSQGAGIGTVVNTASAFAREPRKSVIS